MLLKNEAIVPETSPGENLLLVVSPMAIDLSADESQHVLCIFRDKTSSDVQTSKFTLNLPASTKCDELVQRVANTCSYQVGTFELILQQNKDGNMIIINDSANISLYELGFRCQNNQRNNLVINDKSGHKPIKTLDKPQVDPSFVIDVTDLNFKSSIWMMGSRTDRVDTSTDSSNNLSEGLPSFFAKNTDINRYDTGFVGLVNPAMTCYLNSLLQTLFMTPEFRNSLYRWEFDGVEEEGVKSIPFQLQKLFLQLQTSQKHSVGTTELIRSFGWDSSEAWQQHDVQELCRVMFDALECKFKNTDQANLINCLYQGKLNDYVKCVECENESVREVSFLDIPLVIRPFGATESFKSIEEALKAYVQPEMLDGSNQYHCAKCEKKCNAQKGLKFTSFPYLLTLQLMRFDFDPTTMHRIKLNDRVTFPEVLNVQHFLNHSDEGLTGLCSNNDDCDTMDSGSALDDDMSSCSHGNSTSVSSVDVTRPEDDEGIDVESDKLWSTTSSGSKIHDYCCRADSSNDHEENDYVLFSIMVHSGSASGGHYYAYVRSFDDGCYYCFNDQQVTRATVDDIQRTYGGGAKGSYYTSSTNAYMLMYRRIDKEKNAQFISPNDFPEHIKALQQCMQEQEERDRAQKEHDRSVCRVKLYCDHPSRKRSLDLNTYLCVHKETKLKDATSVAHQILQLDGIIPVDQCRLVKYDGENESILSSFEDLDDEPIGELVNSVKSSFQFDLLLETRPPDKEFEVYKPGGATVKVYVINVDLETILPSRTIRFYLNQTVDEFKDLLSKALDVPCESMRVVLEKGIEDMRLLTSPEKTLKESGFYLSSKVFVEYSCSVDVAKPFECSKMCQILDRYSNTVCLYVTLPKVDKETLDRFAIPPCDTKSSPINWPSSSNELTNVAVNDRTADPDVKDIDDFMNNEQYDISQNVYSDQSEDSSLTDSDRTIVVADEISPRNNSPNLSQNCVVNSLTDRDLLSESLRNSASNSPQDDLCEDERNLSSPEENSGFCKTNSNLEEFYPMNTFNQCGPLAGNDAEATVKRYFRASSFVDEETGENMLRVNVDKRIILSNLKKEFEPYVGVSCDYFKLYKVYNNKFQYECTRLNENLLSCGDDCKLTIKLGRALRKNEYRVKIYQLLVNDINEPIKFLIDWIFAKGMTVLQAKKEIIPEIKDKCNMEIALNRLRLRKKCWRNPATIFTDNQKFGEDISIYGNWEVFIEILPDADLFCDSSQLALYTRRWRPSRCTIDSFVEVILDNSDVDELKQKLSKLSGIDADSIEFAKGQGTFPCEATVLNISTYLDWNPNVTSLNASPLYISDDGHVIYYRDKDEKERELTEDERNKLTNKESVKQTKMAGTTYSPRKEKALKIYTDTTTSKNTPNNDFA